MQGLDQAMTVDDAARRLGVTVRQIERLVAAGTLDCVGTVGRSTLVGVESVHRLSTVGSTRGRPWSTETVAAALDLLRSGHTARLTQSQRSRLLARLRRINADEVVRFARGRVRTHRYRAVPAYLGAIRAQLLVTGATAVNADESVAALFGLSKSQSNAVDGYVEASKLKKLVSEFHLVPDPDGNVTFRVSSVNVDDAGMVDPLVVALDLAESIDQRERAAALRHLSERLGSLK